jgi:hypothetical protein
LVFGHFKFILTLFYSQVSFIRVARLQGRGCKRSPALYKKNQNLKFDVGSTALLLACYTEAPVVALGNRRR